MIVAATISVGTLHAIVASVLLVIGASRIVRLSRSVGQRLQERSDAHDGFEGVSGIG